MTAKTAKAVKAAEDDFDYEELEKLMKGKSSIKLTDENGVEYVARYPRRLVKKLEASGVTVDYIQETVSSATLTGIDEFYERFILPAFNNDGRKVTLEEVIDLFEGLPDPMLVINALIVLYTLPMRALLEKKDPTKSRVQFAFV